MELALRNSTGFSRIVAMQREAKHPLITAARATGVGTLASRILGLIRDRATAVGLGDVRQPGGRRFRNRLPATESFPSPFRRRCTFGELLCRSSRSSSKTIAAKPGNWRAFCFTWLTVFLSGLTIVGELSFLLHRICRKRFAELASCLLKLSAVTLAVHDAHLPGRANHGDAAIAVDTFPCPRGRRRS